MFDTWKWKKRLSEVEDELDTLRRRLSTMEVEWLDTLDRLKKMVGRVVKERARAEAAEPPTEASAEQIPTTPAVDPISARILTRRSRIAHGGPTQ